MPNDFEVRKEQEKSIISVGGETFLHPFLDLHCIQDRNLGDKISTFYEVSSYWTKIM